MSAAEARERRLEQMRRYRRTWNGPQPCVSCGRPKPPGWRGRYCDECRPLVRADAREACARCGGEKEPGAGRHYCMACAPAAEEEARERRELRQRRVPASTLTEAFRSSGMTKADLARALGWYAGSHPSGAPKADTSRVTRAVGLNGQRSVNPATAVRVGAALGLDPVDFGA